MKNDLRKAIYILYIPMLVIEWVVATIVEVIQVIHKSIEAMTLALKNLISDESDTEEPDKEGSKATGVRT